MPHRDELLALRERADAQARELSEAKAELDLLRAAHARKTHEVEDLRRVLRERDPEQATADERGSEDDLDAPFPPGERIRRALGLAAGSIALAALTTTAFLVAAGPPRCHRPGPRAMMAPPVLAHGAMADLSTGAETVHVGRVAEASEPAIVPVGAECTVRVEAREAGDYDCRVEVSCDGRLLYGTTTDTGFVRCGDGHVVRDAAFTARDGDPAMLLDADRRRVVVEEQLGLGTQRVEIALDE